MAVLTLNPTQPMAVLSLNPTLPMAVIKWNQTQPMVILSLNPTQPMAVFSLNLTQPMVVLSLNPTQPMTVINLNPTQPMTKRHSCSYIRNTECVITFCFLHFVCMTLHVIRNMFLVVSVLFKFLCVQYLLGNKATCTLLHILYYGKIYNKDL